MKKSLSSLALCLLVSTAALAADSPVSEPVNPVMKCIATSRLRGVIEMVFETGYHRAWFVMGGSYEGKVTSFKKASASVFNWEAQVEFTIQGRPYDFKLVSHADVAGEKQPGVHQGLLITLDLEQKDPTTGAYSKVGEMGCFPKEFWI